jgi:hypothetical protein
MNGCLGEKHARNGSAHARETAGKSGFRGSCRVPLAELVHSTAGVHNLLLTGVERMAVRTDFNLQILADRRTGGKRISARAGDGDFFVIRMDAGFHRNLMYLLTAESIKPKLVGKPISFGINLSLLENYRHAR